ncbi:MAG: transglycosylase SLT domain-containing protein [Nanoarchaeota archaeon]|mgnify:FL=1
MSLNKLYEILAGIGLATAVYANHPAAKAIDEPTSRPASLEHRIEGFESYNSIVDLIETIEGKFEIPDDLLHLVVLAESNGESEDRFEPQFKKRYIDNGKFSFDKNSLYQDIFKKLKKQNPSLTKEEFKKQLATSVGPAQILYCTAIDYGFRGSIDELRKPENNLEYAARVIKRQSRQSNYDWKKVLTAYNKGSIKGNPTRGHIERGKYYRDLLRKE